MTGYISRFSKTLSIQIIIFIISITFLFFLIHQKLPKLGLADIDDEYIDPVLYSDIINEEENKHILKLANSKFKPSSTIGGVISNYRNSQTAWLPRDDPTVTSILKRICEVLNYPVENSEGIQVVKYERGGYYKEHYDTYNQNNEISAVFDEQGGHRVLNILIYLNENFIGGTTRFPRLDMDITPTKNSGLVFYLLDKQQKKCHPKSLHAGMPVIDGCKIIANIWIRERRFSGYSSSVGYST
jgi:prolyl 4-hydroxylase